MVRPKKYKYVFEKISRHGRKGYYFNMGRSHVRMPDDYGSIRFHKKYEELLILREWRAERKEFVGSRKQMVGNTLKSNLKRAKQRAAKAKMAFDLDYDWVLDRVESIGFKCELTDLPFYCPGGEGMRVNPLAPSLDRIDPKGGYTKDNVRITILAINVMLMDWGTDLFRKISRSFHKREDRLRTNEQISS